MGQAATKSRNRAEILGAEARCIYCLKKPDRVEHMPPLGMFRGRLRPSGLEFATCSSCNNGTSGADVAACFFARIEYSDNLSAWKHREAIALRKSLEAKSPGLLAELFAPGKSEDVLVKSPGGVIIGPGVRAEAGPRIRAYLNLFAAKLGMALFREHMGFALPAEGICYAHCHLNGGLTQQQADAYLTMMPNFGTIAQGKFTASDQFSYRYNSDNRSIIAAIAQFHSNLHVVVIAASDRSEYSKVLPISSYGIMISPGELLAFLPTPGQRYFRRSS